MIVCILALVTAWARAVDSLQYLIVSFVTSGRHGKRFIDPCGFGFDRIFYSIGPIQETALMIVRALFWSALAALNALPLVFEENYFTYDNPLLFWFDIVALSVIIIALMLLQLRKWYDKRCEAKETQE